LASVDAPLVSASDEDAIRTAVEEYGAAWNRHDMAALAELFTDDADWVNIVGMHWPGKAAVGTGHEAFHRTFLLPYSLCYVLLSNPEGPLGSQGSRGPTGSRRLTPADAFSGRAPVNLNAPRVSGAVGGPIAETAAQRAVGVVPRLTVGAVRCKYHSPRSHRACCRSPVPAATQPRMI
jgi:SnoaL-like domain